jgi:hypothetical protein
MKVSADMFGQPGKCIACRQKIRIPKPDQLPPNTIDVYLKDHPEFLRSIKRRSTSRKAVTEVQKPKKADADKPRKITVPLDVLEPLQMLCSQAALLKSESKALDSTPGSARDNKKDQIRKQRRRVSRAIDDLREELRQRLMEVAIELTATQEKIAESNLSVRVGELDFPQYQGEIDRMRRRRDSLERRQQNLRGWIAVEDPYMAGGLRRVDTDATPPREFRVTFRGDEEEKATGLEGLLDGLREALRTRALSEERLESHAQKRVRGSADADVGTDDEALSQANRERALAQIQYFRRRLDQRLKDFASDLEAVAAQLDHARGRHQARTLPTPRFNELERELLRGKTDLVKGRDLIKRALAANSEHDVPAARGTFMQRLTRLNEDAGTTLEHGFAWASVVAMLAALFLSLTGDVSPARAWQVYSGSSLGIWLVIVPVIAAAMTAASVVVTASAIRGTLMAGSAIIVTSIFYFFFHESAFRDTPLAGAIRSADAWYTQPAPLMFGLGILLLYAAAAVSLARVPRLRLWIPGLPAVAVILCVAVATNAFGVRVPAPTFAPVRIEPPTNQSTGHYLVEVIVLNQGGRAMHVRSGTTLRNGYRLMFDEKVGANSWRDLGWPHSVEIGGIRIPAETDRFPNVQIAPDQIATFTYRVAPGNYRASLLPIYGTGSIDLPILIEKIADTGRTVENVDPASPEAPPAEVTEDVPQEDALEFRPSSAEVELRGIIVAGERDPVFSIDVHSITGEIESIKLGLGEELYGGWKVSEFNRQQQTVTLSNEASVIILRRSDRQPLRTTRERN